jgi:sulfoxide reductase heme-binding subunit YedZ
MTLWYLARALGMVALLGFTAATCLGALATVGGDDPRGRRGRVVRQLLHRSVALVALVALTGHVGLLVLDSHVDLGLAGVLVPGLSGYAPFAVALGTLGVWAFALAAISGLARGRLAASRIGPRTWRAVHLAAYGGWALSMGHGVLAGTDTGRAWSTAVYVACGLAVAGALWLRVAAPRRRSPSTAAGRVPAARVLVKEGHR